jgi:hypothetical protein
MKLRDKLATEWRIKRGLPTKDEWIRGCGTNAISNMLGYEVGYEVEEAFCDGFDAAIALCIDTIIDSRVNMASCNTVLGAISLIRTRIELALEGCVSKGEMKRIKIMKEKE